MKAFEYVNPTDVRSAVSALTQAGEDAKVIAGGVDLLGEMKDYIRTPDVVVNLKSIPGLNKMVADQSGLRLGALVTLVDIAQDPTVRQRYTALAEAAHVVGTPQIRNMGTLGGNLCQRPRCWYYRDEDVICLKKGGTTCYAVEGENQYHAILGGGPSWIVHPSDCAPALIALNASVVIAGPKGTRTLPLERFFILPTENVFKENVLYMKIRHKESFDWALSGAAVALRMAGNTIQDARVVLSGVAPIPWRAPAAEAVLRGKTLTAALADQAGAAAVANAKPLGKNRYKVPLTHNTVRLAILHAAGMEA